MTPSQESAGDTPLAVFKDRQTRPGRVRDAVHGRKARAAALAQRLRLRQDGGWQLREDVLAGAQQHLLADLRREAGDRGRQVQLCRAGLGG